MMTVMFRKADLGVSKMLSKSVWREIPSGYVLKWNP